MTDTPEPRRSLTDEEYEQALAELDELARLMSDQRSRQDAHEQAAGRLGFASTLARLFEDGRWVEEQNKVRAERAKTPRGGRPVDPTAKSHFATWVKERYAVIHPAYVYRLIDANDLVKSFFARAKKPPESERQIRPLKTRLARHHPDAVPEVWEAAVKKADGGQPSSTQVNEAVKEWYADHTTPRDQRRESARDRADRYRVKTLEDFRHLLETGRLRDAARLVNQLTAELNAARDKAVGGEQVVA